MARAALADNSIHVSILASADDVAGALKYGCRIVSRTSAGGATTNPDPSGNPGGSGIKGPYAYAQRMTITWNGTSTTVTVEVGLGINYTSWLTLGTQTITGWLGYHGLAASGHAMGNHNDDNSRVRFGFYNWSLSINDAAKISIQNMTTPPSGFSLPAIRNSSGATSQWNGYLVQSRCTGSTGYCL